VGKIGTQGFGWVSPLLGESPVNCDRGLRAAGPAAGLQCNFDPPAIPNALGPCGIPPIPDNGPEETS